MNNNTHSFRCLPGLATATLLRLYSEVVCTNYSSVFVNKKHFYYRLRRIVDKRLQPESIIDSPVFKPKVQLLHFWLSVSCGKIVNVLRGRWSHSRLQCDRWRSWRETWETGKSETNENVKLTSKCILQIGNLSIDGHDKLTHEQFIQCLYAKDQCRNFMILFSESWKTCKVTSNCLVLCP